MKIIFIGCVESSYILLKKLLEINADVVGVITKQNSKFNADFKDLGPVCEKYGVPYKYVKNINDEESLEFVKKVGADIAFCFGWSQIIKIEFLRILPRGAVGYHPAALPANRGRHPIIWALVLGLEETASTFFMIDENADTGDIVSQRKVRISYEDDANSLYGKIMRAAQEQIQILWSDFETDSVIYIPQLQGEGNVWRKRSKEDGKIDWRMSSRAIYNLVRGLTRPYVGAHFEYKGEEVKVWKVEEIITRQYDNIEPGKVLKIYGNGEIDIKAGENVVRIIECDHNSVEEDVYLV